MSEPFLTRARAEAIERVRLAQSTSPRPTDPQIGTDMRACRDVAQFLVDLSAPPSLATALRQPGLAVIAEIKRASPSRGHIADIPDPAALARQYEAGGAAAISVLTEPRHFNGTLEDLAAVSHSVALPVIRKDFVVDSYQLREASDAGAAAILLIVAMLDDEELTSLLRAVDRAGLDALVETHSEDEVKRATAAHEGSGTARPLILGVNARNLQTLEVDLGVVERVASSTPEGAILVAESGIQGPQDAARMAAAGADAILVGEHVAMASDPAGAVQQLRDAVTRPSPDPVMESR